MTKSERIPQHKRKLRNYLLDIGLQLRYTVFIIAVAVFPNGLPRLPHLRRHPGNHPHRDHDRGC
jgi:hypothetical protein